jgi:hypothetical protein
MKHINTVLHQLLKHIPRYRFEQVVERCQGDRRVRNLTIMIGFPLAPEHESRLNFCHSCEVEDSGREVVKRLVA